jgi:hypothetical protein
MSLKDSQARRGGEAAALHLFFLTSVVLASSCIAHAFPFPFVLVHAAMFLIVVVRRVRVRMEVGSILLEVRIITLEIVAERVV